MLKDSLLKELREYFGADTKRINHAEKVLDFAEMLLEHEPADPDIVVPASILHPDRKANGEETLSVVSNMP